MIKKIELIFVLMIVKAFAGYILPWGMQVGPTQACTVKVVVHNLIKNERKKNSQGSRLKYTLNAIYSKMNVITDNRTM